MIEFCKNGELLDWLQRLGSFDEQCTRFYAAEMVLALEHMHANDIIHRSRRILEKQSPMAGGRGEGGKALL